MSNGKDSERESYHVCWCWWIYKFSRRKRPVAGYDAVLGKVDRRNKKQRNYPKQYVQMYRDLMKGNRLKSVIT